MTIVFDLYNVGLGNNGGSRTLIKCGEALSQLGVEVIFFSNVQSKYTWHKPIGIKFAQGNISPRCDVLIATGYKSVEHTLKSRAKRKFYFVRGLELWQASEANLLRSFRQLPCIVNSEWLKSYFQVHNIDAKLIYPGLDFDKFYNLYLPRENVFGSLYHPRHKTKRFDDALVVQKKIGKTKEIKMKILNKDIVDANEDQLRNWYNKIKVWFAPSELEGLHNPPMEASLCGCALVCSNHPRSGMADYAIHNKTALVYPTGNLDIAAKYVEELMKDEGKRQELNKSMVGLLRKKIDTRQKNMKGLLKHIA